MHIPYGLFRVCSIDRRTYLSIYYCYKMYNSFMWFTCNWFFKSTKSSRFDDTNIPATVQLYCVRGIQHSKNIFTAQCNINTYSIWFLLLRKTTVLKASHSSVTIKKKIKFIIPSMHKYAYKDKWVWRKVLHRGVLDNRMKEQQPLELLLDLALRCQERHGTCARLGDLKGLGYALFMTER